MHKDIEYKEGGICQKDTTKALREGYLKKEDKFIIIFP